MFIKHSQQLNIQPQDPNHKKMWDNDTKNNKKNKPGQ